MNHSEREHADISPSSLDRVFNCPGSVAASKTVPPLSRSTHAEQGTMAHELAEKYVRAKLLGEEIDAEGPENMVEGAKNFADLCYSVVDQISGLSGGDVEWWVEKRLQAPSNVVWSEAMWGTPDFIAWARDGDHLSHLCVVDYKFGIWRVSATQNKQLMAYALLAALVSGAKTVGEIGLVIYQPAYKEPVSYSLGYEELQDFQRQFEEVYKKVVEAKEFNTGRWCYFCPYKVKCEKYYESYEPKKAFDALPIVSSGAPTPIGEEKLWEIWERRDELTKLLADIEAYLTHELMSGRGRPEYKVIEGSTRRMWSKDASVESVSKALGLAKEQVSKEVLESIGVVEKRLGEKLPASLTTLTKPSLKIVPEGAKGEAVLLGTTFGTLTNETKGNL